MFHLDLCDLTNVHICVDQPGNLGPGGGFGRGGGGRAPPPKKKGVDLGGFRLKL